MKKADVGRDAVGYFRGGRSSDERAPDGAVLDSIGRASAPTSAAGATESVDVSARSGTAEKTSCVCERPCASASSGDGGVQSFSPMSIDETGVSSVGAAPNVIAARMSQRGAAARALGANSQMTVASAAMRRRFARLTRRTLNPSSALAQAWCAKFMFGRFGEPGFFGFDPASRRRAFRRSALVHLESFGAANSDDESDQRAHQHVTREMRAEIHA